MPALIARRIRVKLKDIKSPKIVVVGLAYKPNTHDMRESPAIRVINILREEADNGRLDKDLVNLFISDEIYNLLWLQYL